jgi:hypothetical protein
MDWSLYDSLSERWCTSSRAYVAAVNDHIRRCNRGEDSGEEPTDDRGELAEAVLAVVREANQSFRATGDRAVIAELRRRFPPAHEPFLPHLKRHAIPVYNPVWDRQDVVFAAIGRPGPRRGTARIALDGKVGFNRKQVLLARSLRREHGLVALHDKIEIIVGPGTYRTLPVPPPSSVDGVIDIDAKRRPPTYLDAAILPGGSGALVVMPYGVFICDERRARRLFPDQSAVEAQFRERERWDFPMIHASLSPDGQHVAVGWQDSPHLVLTLDGEVVSSFGPASAYAHHATFTPDGKTLLASSCHLRNGVTMAVALDAIRGEQLPKADDRKDPRFRPVEWGITLTASRFIGDLFVVGDRNGYLRAYSLDGDYRWEHFCGSSVLGLDLAPDGRRLVVSTAAGYVQILALDTGDPDPFQIGTSTHRELARFVYWYGDEGMRW